MKKRASILVILCFCIMACSGKKAEDNSDVPMMSSYQVTAGTTGSIDGSVKYSGTIQAPAIEIEKDQSTCGTTHPNTSAPANNSGGVSGVLVYLDKITSGKDWGPIATNSTLDQKQCQFSPHIQIVKLGAKIVISNSDPELHNFHITMNGITIKNEAQPPGAPPQEVTMNKAGVNTINCDVHQWMRGYVVVADNPYYTLTDDSGHFSLPNVPPGSYTLKIWRDNWTLDQHRGPDKKIIGYKWGQDFEKEVQVIVKANEMATEEIALP